MPVIRASLLAVLALISCALALNLARAQGPTETGTTLHPGLNLVGWTAEPTPTSQLFDEIPQLEAVWAWDAELRDWITAARGAPEWLGGLGRATAGMGLRMQLSGNEPFHWQRSTEPTRGLVKLRTGWNLVAWSGADQTPIDDALKGIGWSLRNIHRWNPITQQWSIWTSPERTAQLIAADNTDQEANDDSETPTIRRGEALWINVARAVNWLQPTDILPRLVFPGGASDELQTRVREDLESTLAFFRTQYGIQAEPDFTVYVPENVDALIRAYRDDGEDVDDTYEASQRALWDRVGVGGWAGGKIVVKQSSWGRYLLTHEYFHILQRQLRGEGNRSSDWLVEGTASWVDDEHKVLDGERTQDDLRDGLLSAITNDTPTLRSTEDDNAQWEYTLGWLATDQLTVSTAQDFSTEFWRQLAPTEIGPHRRWASTSDWRTVFHRASGQPMSEFYADFDAWQREQATANDATPNSYEYDGNWIRGKVEDAGGEPVAGLFVNAIRVEGETSVGWNQRAETNAAGSFAVRAPEDGDYHLSVNINDNCTRYYSDGQLINDGDSWDDWEEARPIKVSQSDVSGIDIRLSPNVCAEWQIRGRIVGPNAEPLAGISVSAYQTGGGGQWHSSASAADGSFAVTVDESGDYRISADLGHGCSVYYRSGVPTTNSNNALPVTIADAQVNGILIRVPENLCRLRVGGFLDGIERFLDGYVSANLCRITDDGCSSSTSRQLDDDGSFAVATPTSGAYRLTYNFDGCSVHYGPTGVTANAADAALINVDSRDMRVAYRQVPANVCAYEISGTLIGADSQPLTDTWLSACLEEVDHGCAAWPGAQTDDDGAFAITVPVDGPYRLSFDLDGCTVHFGQGRLTSNRDDARLIRVAGRNVQLPQRQVPAGMCAHQIGGRLIGSDGAPLSDVYVSICQLAGDDCATWLGRRTDDDGAFAVTVPSAGSYRLSFNHNGCRIYYRFGGPTTTHAEASPISVTETSAPSLSIRVPEGMCAYQITGSITQADGQPLADLSVRICPVEQSYCEWGRTDDDGTFAIIAPLEGEYRLALRLGEDGCDVHYRPAGLALAKDEASPISVRGSDVIGIQMLVPPGMCAHRISGRFVHANGAPLSEKWINAFGTGSSGGVWTDPDGRFEIRVPSDGAYAFGIRLRQQPSCWYHLVDRALGSRNNPIRVSGADVTGITLRLPDTIEELCK